ncbi:hypothetical protein LIPSTDRAFT_226615 [Lipomyces starkeyi NRRL Y-11557]|uniref:Uncharacterized protein n=1 Tax=Lipomyces starkeyi NRRL Y-11557 TaxID=675824 RepID=A0A1E3PTN2_LIPST|nr:hypothetical protein LIPSTDRAFT_226615 [Lipomyces starkeyi NRRL Y-11557]
MIGFSKCLISQYWTITSKADNDGKSKLPNISSVLSSMSHMVIHITIYDIISYDLGEPV